MADACSIAVLTGDLVGSSRLDPAQFEAVRERVTQCATAVRKWPGANPIGFEFFRGDSWQFALAGPGYALRAAVLVRAALRGHPLLDAGTGKKIVPDSRIAIAIGDGGTPDPRRVSLSTAPAFVESGRTLDAIPDKRRMEVAGDTPRDRMLRGAVRLCEALMVEWTAAQCEAIWLRLSAPGTSDKEIAHWLRISAPTLSRRLASSRWALLDEGLALFEAGLG